jgi:hypothetical protein
MTLTIPLQGGLGNQLFQLAAGIAVAQRTERPVRFSDFWLRHPGRHETPRVFSLGGLIGPDELTRAWAPRLPGLSDRLPGVRIVERSSNDDALGRVRSTTLAVAGYFQRLEYVEEAWPELRSRLESSPKAEHREAVLPQTALVGAMHYRLGDYLRHPGTRNAHGVTAPEYFVEEIRRAAATQGVARWRVVSDDPTAAVELLATAELPSTVTVEPAVGRDEWADLLILGSARICLLSNSSFSWWAGFFGMQAHGMKVVAPSPWFADPTATEPDFFPPGWERRPRRLMADHPLHHSQPQSLPLARE